MKDYTYKVTYVVTKEFTITANTEEEAYDKLWDDVCATSLDDFDNYDSEAELIKEE